jgi:hypothetical protein
MVNREKEKLFVYSSSLEYTTFPLIPSVIK